MLLIAAIYCTYEHFNPTQIAEPNFKFEPNFYEDKSLLEKVPFGPEDAITAFVIGAISIIRGSWYCNELH